MGTETIFWYSAFFGLAFFIIRAIAIFMGLGADHGGDVYHDVDSAGGTEASFRIFSLHTLSAFFMFFGFGGLAGLKQYGFTNTGAVGLAMVLGTSGLIFTAYIFRMALSLAHKGARFTVQDCMGKGAEVYERIPADGLGRIQLSVAGSIREVLARSEKGEVINSGTRVEVVRVVDNATVSVVPTR